MNVSLAKRFYLGESRGHTSRTACTVYTKLIIWEKTVARTLRERATPHAPSRVCQGATRAAFSILDHIAPGGGGHPSNNESSNVRLSVQSSRIAVTRQRHTYARKCYRTTQTTYTLSINMSIHKHIYNCQGASRTRDPQWKDGYVRWRGARSACLRACEWGRSHASAAAFSAL